MSGSPTPKYQAVHDAILARLHSGQYSVGSRLPTEGALSEAFGVSRVTIRKSLELLVRSGYLTARQGSGYVVTTISPPTTTCMASFTDQVLNEGRIPGAKLIALENPTVNRNAEVSKLFDEPLILVQRLRHSRRPSAHVHPNLVTCSLCSHALCSRLPRNRPRAVNFTNFAP